MSVPTLLCMRPVNNREPMGRRFEAVEGANKVCLRYHVSLTEVSRIFIYHAQARKCSSLDRSPPAYRTGDVARPSLRLRTIIRYIVLLAVVSE